MTYRILIVEDDARIAGSVQNYLNRYGYEAHRIHDFRQVEQEFVRVRPHLVIMDINLPYQDGYHLTRVIRRRSSIPICFLTARAGDVDQILGIESGGDDYVTKPFNLDVLHAKLRALLRRAYGEYAGNETQAALTVGALKVDLAAGAIEFRGQSQTLTRNELRLMHLLMRRADEITTREECLEAIWDDATFVDDNNLTVNITRLRAKLDAWGLKDAIETRRGMGYQLVSSRLGG